MCSENCLERIQQKSCSWNSWGTKRQKLLLKLTPDHLFRTGPTFKTGTFSEHHGDKDKVTTSTTFVFPSKQSCGGVFYHTQAEKLTRMRKLLAENWYLGKHKKICVQRPEPGEQVFVGRVSKSCHDVFRGIREKKRFAHPPQPESINWWLPVFFVISIKW